MGASNKPVASTTAIVYYAVRTLTGDRVPSNDGCYRPVRIVLPPDSIVHASYPAPVGSRGVALKRIEDVVLGAFARLRPDGVGAAHGALRPGALANLSAEIFRRIRDRPQLSLHEKIFVSPEGDGGFAVVDIDTYWRKRDGSGDLPNKGRACKIYTLMPDGWKMLHQPGTMQYPVGT